MEIEIARLVRAAEGGWTDRWATKVGGTPWS
jgi:hypothetical protein